MIYVAVGFKVKEPKSIFYLKSKVSSYFFHRLETLIASKHPDFVSLRFIEET